MKFVSKLLSIALSASMMIGAAAPALAENQERISLSWYNINPPYDDNSWGEKTFEEMYNVDVQVVRAESSDELSTMLAGGEIPDVIAASVDTIGTYQKLGILAEITEDEIKEYMPGYYAMCMERDDQFFTYGMIDGKLYGITQLRAVGGIAQTGVIRADWLEACGITKVPKTIEELEEAFVAFTFNDPDGNGQNDTYAMSSGSDKEGGKRFFSSIFGAYGINPFCWTDVDGQAAFGFTTDACKEALKTLNRWYEMGLIDPEFVTDECRTSGTDIAYKFANGIIGYIDGFNYDDYQWDNDGHVNAKWVAANPEWQTFFTENEGDEAKLYGKANVTDFSDDMVKPYYIVMDELTGPAGGKAGFYAGSNISGYLCFGQQLEEDRDKLHRAMQIIDDLATNEQAIVNHYGPEGYIWQWNEDHTQRVWIENYSDKADYNPQGQIMGNGQYLWAMYATNPEYLDVIGGARIIQRYDLDLATFSKFNTVPDIVKVSLPTAAENPDLVYAYPLEYIVKAIRGNVNIDETWDSTIETWYKNGGTKLTEEANAWYQGTR